MTKDHRTHIIDGGKTDEEIHDLSAVPKQEFGRRVYRLMIGKGWRQSDLARAADIPRDSVSTYVRGITFPTPLNLEKLAKALDVDSHDLLPKYTQGAMEADDPDFEMRISPGNTSRAWVKVNRMVTTATAVKIAELLSNDGIQKDEAANGN